MLKNCRIERRRTLPRELLLADYYIQEGEQVIICEDDDGKEVEAEPEEILISTLTVQQGCCEKIEEIKKELEEFKAGYDWDAAWDIFNGKCGDDEYDRNANTIEGKASGFRALIGLQMAMFSRLNTLMEAICGIETSYSIPEHWQIPMEARRPQLIIDMAEYFGNKRFGSAKYRITIPHFTGNIKTPPPFEYMDKGSVQGTQILTDNSKIICYAKNQAEADRILDLCLPWVQPIYTIDSQRKYTIHEDESFQEFRAFPRRGTFWPRGKKIGEPDWTINYEVDRRYL